MFVWTDLNRNLKFDYMTNRILNDPKEFYHGRRSYPTNVLFSLRQFVILNYRLSVYRRKVWGWLWLSAKDQSRNFLSAGFNRHCSLAIVREAVCFDYDHNFPSIFPIYIPVLAFYLTRVRLKILTTSQEKPYLKLESSFTKSINPTSLSSSITIVQRPKNRLTLVFVLRHN